jgi:membrane fusion protein, multidrug efflux system
VLNKHFWRGAIVTGTLCVIGVTGAALANGSTALQTAVAARADTAQAVSFDGVVEAARQTVIAAQVAGAVVALEVKAGDTVKAGQVLARIDARAAEQGAAASDAQVVAARAALEEAAKDFERQKQLYQKDYVSQAALQRAEAQFKSAQAQVDALLAQAGATRTQSGFFVVRAPYGGVVSDVPVTLGDMAMPGRPLLTLYDPAALRVTAAVPQSIAAGMTAAVPGAQVKAQIPGLPSGREWIVPARVRLLPAADAATHTMQLRLDLPPAIAGIRPGMFARVWLPGAADGSARILVPARAIVRRAEMTGLYVVGQDGRPLLRQVRLGPAAGDTVEVLSGVSAGERVALDPQAAARVR